LAGCQKPVADPSPPPPPNSEQVAKARYELDEKCGADARAWFKANYSEPPDPIKVEGGREIASLPSTYQNHYSHTFNGCFAVLDTITSFPAPHAQVVRTDALWDVNENRRVGVLVQKDMQTVTACDVEGTKCATKDEFEGMARHYMTE